MGVAKVILIGGFGFGLAAWFIHAKSASALSSSANTTPPAPPVGAVVTVETFANPMAVAGLPTLKRSSWHVAADATGQEAGTFMLTQNAANPNDWVYSFKNDAGGGAGVIGYSQTPNGGLLAQGVAGGQ